MVKIKRFLSFLTILSITIFSFSMSTSAKVNFRDLDKMEKRTYKSQKGYDEAIAKAKEDYKNIDSSISYARSLYVYTNQFTLFSDKILDEMTALAYKYEHDEDINERHDALNKYKALVELHLANIDVVKLAYVFAERNPVLGNKNFYKRVISAIHNAIMAPGYTGYDYGSAYPVITMGEEQYVLSQIGVHVISSENVVNTNVYYDVYQVRNLKDGKISEVYFDVSLPLRETAKREELKKKKKEMTVPKN